MHIWPESVRLRAGVKIVFGGVLDQCKTPARRSRGCVFESHTRQKLTSVAHSLSADLPSTFGQMGIGFRQLGVLRIELGLKMRVCVFRRLTVARDCTGTPVENDINVLEKQYTYGHRICPPHRTTHVS